MLDNIAVEFIEKYHSTKSITVACELCDYLYKQMQEGERNEKN